MIKEKISAMSDEHQNSLKSLAFYKEELKSIRTRLTDMAGKNTAREFGSNVEHFENQISVQLENIDTLHHNINDNLSKIADQLKHNTAGYVDGELIENQKKQNDTFAGIEKVVNELRQEFNKFASAHL